jgi:hypothetical protein
LSRKNSAAPGRFQGEKLLFSGRMPDFSIAKKQKTPIVYASQTQVAAIRKTNTAK